MTNNEGFAVRLTPEDYGRLEASLRTGDMTELYAILTMLAENRSRVLAAVAASASAPERDVTREILQESRVTERFIYDLVRRVQDDMHAEQMQKLTKSSNNIAATAGATAESLRNWTKVLVGATVVLAVATIVLVVATFRLSS